MAAAAASCLVLPCKPKFLSVNASSGRLVLLPISQRFESLAFSASLCATASPYGGSQIRAMEKPIRQRSSFVCQANPKSSADSAAKRARQAEKRRVYNKAKKSEVKTRMRKVLEELDGIKKKTDAKADEIIPVEKLIAEAYSAIDKAVKSGTLHKNTGAHRKSRLARRKKTVEIHHGWYVPAAAAA